LTTGDTSKENLHFDDQVFFFFASQNFLKEIGNMFSVCLSHFSIYKSSSVLSQMLFSDWLHYSLSILR